MMAVITAVRRSKGVNDLQRAIGRVSALSCAFTVVSAETPQNR
jgi:hypothetical protein